MELTFSQLKQKEVINLNDGKNLGKSCDMTFSFPENNVLGITVTGSKGFKFCKQDLFIPVQSIVKVGEDTVLVKLGHKENCPPEKPPKRPPNNCPPNNCPPPRPPKAPPDRRSYDEYD